MYTEADLRLLQRALFLRRARGLNPAAIVHVLKKQGVVSAPAEVPQLPGQLFRRLRLRRKLSLSHVARDTGVSVGFLSSLERGQMRCSIGTLRRIARFYKTNIMALFETLNAAGHTIVVVTHEHDIAKHAHRIITFHDGAIAEDVANKEPLH